MDFGCLLLQNKSPQDQRFRTITCLLLPLLFFFSHESVDQLAGSFAGFAAGRPQDCAQLRASLAGRPSRGLIFLAGAAGWRRGLGSSPCNHSASIRLTAFLTVISRQWSQKARGNLRASLGLGSGIHRALFPHILLVKARNTLA